MGIEEVGMHDNMSLTQSEEPNPRRTLQNLKPDRKNQQRGLTGSIPGLMEHERIAAFLFPRSSSHPSPNSSQVFAAMQLPRVGGWGRGGWGLYLGSLNKQSFAVVLPSYRDRGFR